MSPEWALIFRSAGAESSGEWNGFEAPDVELDWASLVLFAHGKGALPRIADLAERAAFPGMPKEIRAQLAVLERLHAFRAGIMEDLLRALSADLADKGLSLLVLKGAALAATVYPGFSHRTMGDLDLLVRADEARQAEQVALSSGWCHVEGVPGAAFYDAHHHLPPLEDARGLGIRLELHHHIMPAHAPFVLPVEQLWASATPAGVIAGASSATGNPSPVDVRVPSPELLLLHACIHFAWSHCLWTGAWKAFRDVALILRSPLLDLDEFLKLAKSAKALGASYWTLHLAWHLCGIEEAKDLRDRLEVRVSQLRRDALSRHFMTLASGGAPPNIPLRLHRRLWEMALLPEREGHNGARPWDVDPMTVVSVGEGDLRAPASASRTERFRNALYYLARLRETFSYLVRLR